MKNTIIILMAVILSISSFAQTTSPQVVSSAGWDATGGGVELSQTIGEMSMVSTLTGANAILTQGFEQPELIYPAGIQDFKSGGGALALFPNPATDHFDLAYSFPKEGKLTAGIYDALGQKVSQEYENNYSSGSQTLHINSSELPAGLYFVRTSFTTLSGEQYDETKKVEVLK